MDEDFTPRRRSKDNSMIWWLVGGVILLYVLKSGGVLGPTCGTDITGTNTCLPAGPTILPDTGGYSVQGGGVPPNGWGDNPNDYWDMLASYGRSLN